MPRDFAPSVTDEIVRRFHERGGQPAIAYGIVLQAVEIATALIMGLPALVNEGLSWREVRLRAMHVAPVRLAPLPEAAVPGRAAASGVSGG